MMLKNLAMRRKSDNMPDADVKFGSDALVMCDWIDTTNFVLSLIHI